MPSPTTPPSPALLELITARQAELQLTEADLASSIGYDKGVIVAMIKSGAIKLPVTKIPALAMALELEASTLLVLAIKEGSPELLKLIEQVWGPLDLTPAEARLVQTCRTLAGGRTVAPIVFADAVVALVTV